MRSLHLKTTLIDWQNLQNRARMVCDSLVKCFVAQGVTGGQSEVHDGSPYRNRHAIEESQSQMFVGFGTLATCKLRFNPPPNP